MLVNACVDHGHVDVAWVAAKTWSAPAVNAAGESLTSDGGAMVRNRSTRARGAPVIAAFRMPIGDWARIRAFQRPPHHKTAVASFLPLLTAESPDASLRRGLDGGGHAMDAKGVTRGFPASPEFRTLCTIWVRCGGSN